jgi:hypothetical protein
MTNRSHGTVLCFVISQLCSRCVLEEKEPIRIDIRMRRHNFTGTPYLNGRGVMQRTEQKNLEIDRTKFK